jgi:hypothetical protein
MYSKLITRRSWASHSRGEKAKQVGQQLKSPSSVQCCEAASMLEHTHTSSQPLQQHLTCAQFPRHTPTMCRPLFLSPAGVHLAKTPSMLGSRSAHSCAVMHHSWHACTETQTANHCNHIIQQHLTCAQFPNHTLTLCRPPCLLPAGGHLAKTPGMWGSRSAHSSGARMRLCPRPIAVRCGRCCLWQCTGCWGAMRQCPHQTGGLHAAVTACI